MGFYVSRTDSFANSPAVATGGSAGITLDHNWVSTQAYIPSYPSDGGTVWGGWTIQGSAGTRYLAVDQSGGNFADAAVNVTDFNQIDGGIIVPFTSGNECAFTRVTVDNTTKQLVSGLGFFRNYDGTIYRCYVDAGVKHLNATSLSIADSFVNTGLFLRIRNQQNGADTNMFIDLVDGSGNIQSGKSLETTLLASESSALQNLAGGVGVSTYEAEQHYATIGIEGFTAGGNVDVSGAPTVAVTLDSATNMVITSPLKTSVTLAISAVSGGSGTYTYWVRYRLSGSSGAWTSTTPATSNTTPPQASVTGLTQNTAYEMQVGATDGSTSAFSQSLTVHTADQVWVGSGDSTLYGVGPGAGGPSTSWLYSLQQALYGQGHYIAFLNNGMSGNNFDQILTPKITGSGSGAAFNSTWSNAITSFGIDGFLYQAVANSARDDYTSTDTVPVQTVVTAYENALTNFSYACKNASVAFMGNYGFFVPPNEIQPGVPSGSWTTPDPYVQGQNTGMSTLATAGTLILCSTRGYNDYYQYWNTNGQSGTVHPGNPFYGTYGAAVAPDFLAALAVADTVGTPTFSPAAGTYTAAQTVMISTATSGASIYYTLDGSNPTPSSTLYTVPIAINASKTVKAIAAKNGTASGIASAAYVINYPQASTPTFSPAAGTYTSTQTVTITSTVGASIRYTTDGSTPSETVGTVYTSPISVAATETVKAIAYGTSFTDSAVGSALFTINVSSGGGSGLSQSDINAIVAAVSTAILDTANGAGTGYTVRDAIKRVLALAVGNMTVADNVQTYANPDGTASVAFSLTPTGGPFTGRLRQS